MDDGSPQDRRGGGRPVRPLLRLLGRAVVALSLSAATLTVGGLALAKVGYGAYLRFIAPLLGILLILITGFLALGAVLS